MTLTHARISSTGLLVAGLSLWAAQTAHAQSPSIIHVLRQPLPGYTPSTGLSRLSTANSNDNEYDVRSPFPIRFYGETYSTLRVGDNGAILFPAAGQAISPFNPAPGTSGPQGFLAPLWDDLFIASNGEVGWKVEGQAPRRRLIVEWRNASGCCSQGRFDASFRAVFFEGPVMNIAVEYGTLSQTTRSFSATMAMEDQSGMNVIQFAMRDCNSGCSNADVTAMSNQRVLVIEDAGPDLSATDLQPPALAFEGVPVAVPVRVFNSHGNPLGPFSITIEGSLSPTFTTAVPIGTTPGLVAPALQTVAYDVQATLPTGFAPNRVYLRAIVDSTDSLAETVESNNVIEGSISVRAIDGAPDLAIRRVTPKADTVNAASNLEVVIEIENAGSEDASDVPVRVVLSENQVISRQDLAIGQINVTLAAGQMQSVTVSTTVPGQTNSGPYFVGALADPDNDVEELDEINNSLASFDTVTVQGAGLRITTTNLPRATRRVPYVALLQAVGAGPDPRWTIVNGVLPAGMGLVATTGELFGRPINAETQTFTVQIESDGNVDSQTLTLVVSDPQEPLTLVNRQVPTAVVGQEYSFQLLAAGGAGGPLTWSASGLPDGLRITPNGVISGTPTSEGIFTVTARVTDGTVSAERSFELEVIPNRRLLIVPSVLSAATFAEEYSGQLQAQGGLPPYVWIVESGRLPSGLNLAPNGAISGVPLEVGTFRFEVEARDSAIGSRAARDADTFVLIVEEAPGFKIDTLQLADGQVDVAYDVFISASNGAPPYDWALEAGRLPDGLIGEVDGSTGDYRIRGQPTQPGVTNLLVLVRDARGREDRRAYALRIVEPEVTETQEPTGCVCATGTTEPSAVLPLSFVVLLGLVGVGRRTRFKA